MTRGLGHRIEALFGRFRGEGSQAAKAWDLNTCAAALGRCRIGTNPQFRFGGWRRPQSRTSVALPLRAASASRRIGSFVANTSVATARTCGRGALPDPATGIATLPPKMRIARSSTFPSTVTVTSHPAIARSKISPPIDVTTSATFVATTCSRYRSWYRSASSGAGRSDFAPGTCAGLFRCAKGLAGAATSCPFGWLDDFH